MEPSVVIIGLVFQVSFFLADKFHINFVVLWWKKRPKNNNNNEDDDNPVVVVVVVIIIVVDWPSSIYIDIIIHIIHTCHAI